MNIQDKTIAIIGLGYVGLPDPRAFAMHKVWLSRLPEREPIKKPRDLEQAQAVAKLVQAEMPHLSFETTLTSLHGDVRKLRPLLNI